MKILVFSLRYSKFGWLSVFPQVRGHVLAKYLRQLGEDAEFRALPVEGHFDVAICADYQGDARWLSLLQERMTGLTARRMFCMVDYGATKHPSAPMAEWFAARGGVLCHLRERSLAAHEHYIGLGVDDVVRYDPTRARGLFQGLLTKFPGTKHRDDAAARMMLLDDVLRTRRVAAARERDLEDRIAKLERETQTLRVRIDSSAAQSDSLRGVIARVETLRKDRETELAALRLELQRLKEIDLKPRPTRPPT